MGGGTYSINSTGNFDKDVLNQHRITRGVTYSRMSREETFQARSVNNVMNPHGVNIRESRDSEEHPNSLAIILALDVTGSMGSIPHYLVRNGLPDIMGNIIQRGIKDPQMLFIAIGDHECDDAPLQAAQFESSDELLDKWLTDVWLEGGGGGNAGESYFLAWYFAAMHTSIDCFEKRNQKGFLFTIGDEPVLRQIPKTVLKRIMGDGQYSNFSAMELLDKAKEKYNVYHLHLKQGSNGMRQEVIDGWKQIIGDNLILIDNKEEVAKYIVDIVSSNTKLIQSVSEKTSEEGQGISKIDL